MRSEKEDELPRWEAHVAALFACGLSGVFHSEAVGPMATGTDGTVTVSWKEVPEWTMPLFLAVSRIVRTSFRRLGG